MSRTRPPSSEIQSDDNPPKRLQLKPSSEDESDNTLLKRLRQTRKFSAGLVRLGSKPMTYDLQLFPLVAHSMYVRRRVESIAESDGDGSPIVIDLPNCPGDVNIFRTVEDCCHGLVHKNDISVSNVVKLMATCSFLQIESLKRRALKFLEERIFNSWESCLRVLATFDETDLSNFGEGTLFNKCERTFLKNIQVDLYSDICTCTMSYSVQTLLRVAQLLPPNVTNRIYQSCRREKFGLFSFSDMKATNFSLFTHLTGKNKCEGARGVSYVVGESIQWDRCIEEVSAALPDFSRRTILMLHVAKSMLLEDDVNSLNPKIQHSFFRWEFLSALLFEVVELRTMTQLRRSSSEDFVSVTDMDTQIENIQRLVGRGLGEGYHWKSAEDGSSKLLQEQDFVLEALRKFKFETLLSVVRHFKDSGSKRLHNSSIAKILDACLERHLQAKTFTVKQALLIYQEFPNNSRSSHSEIYHVFEDFLRRNALSPQEVLDLTKLLDYSKLSDQVVEKLMAELQFNNCDPQLRERFMERQQGHQIDQKKSNEEFIKLRNEHSIQSANLMKLECELDWEKEKATCQICFTQPRNALSLPCMHFMHCSDCLQQHHRKSKTCPTCCRSTIGVLKCILKV